MSYSFIQLRRSAYRNLMQQFPHRLRAGAAAYWIEVLLRANYEPGHANGQLLQRGQFLFGRDELAKTVGLSPRNVRTLTDHFEKHAELTINATSHGSIGTIVNYNAYVGTAFATDPPNDQQMTSKRPASDHSEETNKPIIKEDIAFEEAYRIDRNIS